MVSHPCSLRLEMDPDKHPWTGEEIWIQILKLIFFSTGKEPPNFLFILFLISLTKQYFSDHVNFIYWLPSNCMVSNWMALQDWKWNADCLTCRWVSQACAVPAVRADCSQMLRDAVGFNPAESSLCSARNHLALLAALGKKQDNTFFSGRMSPTNYPLSGRTASMAENTGVLVVIEISICSCWVPAELCYLSLTLDEN